MSGATALPPALRFLVVGSPRSGTTLVQRLAAGVVGVAVPPETHFFTVGLPGAGWPGPRLDPGAARRLLQRYASLEVTEGLPLDLPRLLDGLPARSMSVFEVFDHLVSHLAGGDVDVVGEKTPHHLRWVGPLLRAMPDLKVIGVVRDPRGVVASNLAVDFGMRHADVLADMWRDDLREVRAARRRLGADRCLLLRFEHVVDHPDVASRTIHRFLGTDARPPREVAPEEIYVPGEASHKGRVTGAVDASRVHAWRDVLAHDQLAVVEAICGAAMVGAGYTPVTRRRERVVAVLDARSAGRLAARRAHRARERVRVAMYSMR